MAEASTTELESIAEGCMTIATSTSDKVPSIESSKCKVEVFKDKIPKAVKIEGSSPFFSAMNITNNIVGSGIITISLAIRDSGVGVGLIFLILSGLACGWSFMVIAMCAEICKTNTYEKTVKKIMGKYSMYILTFCTIIFPLSGAMAYGIVICDNLSYFMEYIAPNFTIIRLRFLLAFFPFYIVILPLSICKNLGFLDKFSSISIALVIFYVSVVIVKSISLPSVTFARPGVWKFCRVNAVKSLPVFAFAASCHHNAVSLYTSMKNHTISNFQTPKAVSFLLSILLYIIVGVCGYVSFGGFPQGNIFNSYCTDDILIAITRLIFAITLMLTAPMQVFGAREALISRVFLRYNHSPVVRISIAFFLVTICYIIAATVTNLSAVVEIGSALTAVPIVYIFPALCSLKLYGPPYYPITAGKCVALSVLTFGTIIFFTAPIFSIIEAVKGDQVLKMQKYYCNIQIYQNQ